MSDGLSKLLIVSLVFLGMGGYFLFYDIPKKEGADQQFIERGVAAKGELVQKLEETTGARRNKSTTYYLRIAYQHPKEGRKICKLEVTSEAYKKIMQDTPLTILYMPENSDSIRIQGVSSVSPWLVTVSKFGFWIGLLGVGFIGFLFVRERFGS